ncbi:MAG: extracellular solute-binding protein [Acidilobaceae archaeon]|nr:extracellular solute-binding protein [Acidilobaceae archaeon]MDW7974754.1 extracellular solute-binding protein [Sulfolobales archaeon]
MSEVGKGSSILRTVAPLLALFIILTIGGALLPYVLPEETVPTMPPVTPPSAVLDSLQIGTSQIRVPVDLKTFAEKAKRGEVSVSINVWTSLTPLEAMAFNSIISQFGREYPGIKVNHRGAAANMKEVLRASIRDAENSAHVLSWTHNWTGELAEGALIVSLSQVLPRETLEDLRAQYAPFAYSAGIYKQELYGLPWAAESTVLICNADLTGGVLPQRFSQLEEIMARYHKPERGTYGLAWQVDPYHVYPIVTAFGGFYYDEEKDQLGLNSPGTVTGFFLLSHVLPYMFTRDVGHEAQLSLFEEGRAPCIITGSWNVLRIGEKVRNILVGPVPEIEGKTPRPFSAVRLMWVTKAAESDKDRLYASLLFVLWFTLNDNVAKTLVEEARLVPVKLSAIDFVRKNAEKYSAVAGALSAVANGALLPKSTKMAKVWGPLREALSAMISIYNEKGKEEALRQLRPLLEEAQRKAAS